MKENFFQIMLSSSLEDNIVKNQTIFDTFEDINYKMYTFRDIHKEFYKNNTSEISKAFSNVKAYAFKADLFRYYLLYEYGGWYSDLNNIFLGNKINTEFLDFYAFKDDVPGSSVPESFQNSILYAKKNNKIIKQALEMSIENVLNCYYGDHPLEVTGPSVIGKAVYDTYDNIAQLGRFTIESGEQRVFLLDDGTSFAYYKPKGYSPANSGLVGGNSYNDLWSSKKLYE